MTASHQSTLEVAARVIVAAAVLVVQVARQVEQAATASLRVACSLTLRKVAQPMLRDLSTPPRTEAIIGRQLQAV